MNLTFKRQLPQFGFKRVMIGENIYAVKNISEKFDKPGFLIGLLRVEIEEFFEQSTLPYRENHVV